MTLISLKLLLVVFSTPWYRWADKSNTDALVVNSWPKCFTSVPPFMVPFSLLVWFAVASHFFASFPFACHLC